jgi:hypothetical protein
VPTKSTNTGKEGRKQKQKGSRFSSIIGQKYVVHDKRKSDWVLREGREVMFVTTIFGRFEGRGKTK